MNLIGSIFATAVLFMSFPALSQFSPEMSGADGRRTAAAFNRNQPARVSVSFRMPLDTASDDTEIVAAEKARKALYAQALNECSLIVENFSNADCRLENIQIMIQMQNNGARQFQYVSANATYALTMK
jgi:hypothetical protein